MDMKPFSQQAHKKGYKQEPLHSRQSGVKNTLSRHVPSAGNEPPLLSVTSHQASVPPEKEALASKLTLEIEQLEVWLENQQNAQQGSISVIPTIKSLIHTRKKLLKNILAS
ncbi:hypothetical protein A9Q81_20010 [Gammaproteobacteria bacterium 42_54_T18]|nr:hypothetical protein A9Q81_20010 [Gammaproteobacteria bacterium 42_54_T18]